MSRSTFAGGELYRAGQDHVVAGRRYRTDSGRVLYTCRAHR